MHWRTSLLLTSAFATVALLSVALLLPVPFVVLRPGPAINTLGTDGGHPLISVSGHPTYPTTGTLDLTTVTVSGGPGERLSLVTALWAWFDRTIEVVPQDQLYPPGQTAQVARQENQQEMVGSQQSATVAALRSLGIIVPIDLAIDSVVAGMPPSTLRPKDQVIALAGVPLLSDVQLRAQLAKVTPGSTLAVTVIRDGHQLVLQAPTRRAPGGGALLGIRGIEDYRPPFEVKIQINDVGGPSAGLMFALGIIDTLTPGDLTGGQRIAGTGTIDADGTVGPIGGIAEKLVGARRTGAVWFLAPSDNCSEVKGHVPDGLHVVRVNSLTDARAAVGRIASGRDVAALPSCG
jgi:Lon-like protease